jgi:KH domain
VKSNDGITVQIPRHLHHRVSNDGRTKNQLRQRYQVYVSYEGAQIPPATKPPVNGTLGRIDDDEQPFSWHVLEDAANPTNETIRWRLRSSNEANLLKAKTFLEDIVKSIPNGPLATGFLSIPSEHHYLIIGKGGQQIGQVRDKTGCTIDVPNRGDKNDVIIIRGCRNGVEKAKELIIEAVEQGQYRSNGVRGAREL